MKKKSKENVNLFSDWKSAVNDVTFVTRSPHPEIPCFISPVELPKCSNYSSFLSENASFSEVRDYLKNQVYILRFNNPKFSQFKIWSAITRRLAYWQGNKVLLKDKIYLNDLLHDLIKECFNDENYASKIEMEYTKYWYSDEILKLPAEHFSKSERSKAKRAARTTAIADKYYIETMRLMSYNYQNSNFQAKPTIKILKQETGISDPTIKKYGMDFFISHGENMKQRVKGAREAYPHFTQQEIADLLGENKRTIRQYWNSINK